MEKEREFATEKGTISMKDEKLNPSSEYHETHADQHDEYGDISNYSKEELMQLLEKYKLSDHPSQDNNFLKEIKSHFDHLIEVEKDQALQKFIEEGGKEEDFELKKDKTTQKFIKTFDELKSKISQSFNSIEKEKDKNLKIKNELLDRLRNLTSSEETTTSINTFKEIQETWRKTGQVPVGQAQGLWASYNALVEMFYNNRSIYFELKELDRKKNLEAKKELCEKVEKLAESNSINNAVRELRTLHDEFKFIGPVPKEDQEALWNRFKVASDKIYDKRKNHYTSLKKQQDENYKKKQEIFEKIEAYSNFQTDKIDEWKVKTSEVLALQEEWKKSGMVSKEHAKDISKKFWSACKAFFNHKNAFFKQLEAKKEENLKLKIELCEKAEALKDSEDLKQTASTLKDLQKQWENIGPVPIKVKEEIFKRFKNACDSFFSRKREHHAEAEVEFVENLKKKVSVCEKIEQLSQQEEKDHMALKALQEEWKGIGFVPRTELKNINDRYNKAIEKYISGLENVSNDEKDSLKLTMQLAALKGSPSADKKLHKKEGDIHRRISTLKKEIDRYNININFLSRSSKADKLREEINSKIQETQNELKTLEDQLKMIKQAS